MRATVLYSGGKDSSYALYWALHQGFDVKVLSSVIPCYEYSMLYHKPKEEVLRMQAGCLGIPLRYTYVCREDEELDVLLKLLKRVKSEFDVEAVFSGAILSDFQRMRFSMAAEEVGLKSYTPLWRINQERYMYELLDTGFEILIMSASAMGFPSSLVGKTLSRDDVRKIIMLSRKYGFNPAFEGGEAETIVTYMPHSRCRLAIKGNVKRIGKYNYIYVIDHVGKEEVKN
jgi:diphthine-ammonia ligase